MKACKPKEEIMWAVHGVHGLYVGTAYTRKEMKQTHMSDLGILDWKECAKNVRRKATNV